MVKTFAIIGAAGYIAPKHMRAIQDVNGVLIAAMDPHDSVGILDRYAPECQFFTESSVFERFIRERPIDYLVICAPNYLHESYIQMGLRNKCNIICEKPLVINPGNLKLLEEMEKFYHRKVHPILQMRQIQLNTTIACNHMDSLRICIHYHTYRGPWYDYSWKMDKTKSGGLAFNIGIHLFDLMIYLFGNVKDRYIEVKNSRHLMGKLYLQMADIYFDLSINQQGVKRSIEIEGQHINLNTGFDNLHTKCYKEILAGRGLRIDDTKKALDLCWRIENE